ncbi:hypothetical protein SAMN05444169_6315 [Bradyrhizobium erythrophlei]|uniref:Helix-turn-helix domain-containing protein n=2 Tax=Bradyrhizobium erythrophlei TaxID=1437360 RepID=A0A1M5R2Y2_9BRAD|nr:hypothetical protein SAMN05444169_6315 [Bradyrhizobium erythrophlei]
MRTADENNWRDGVFVTPAKAASILGYSIGTVRNLLFNEGLRAVRQARGGPMFVTVESLIELIDGAEPVSKAELARLARAANHSAPLALIQGGRK